LTSTQRQFTNPCAEIALPGSSMAMLGLRTLTPLEAYRQGAVLHELEFLVIREERELGLCFTSWSFWS
jgi:hypothetical protein